MNVKYVVVTCSLLRRSSHARKIFLHEPSLVSFRHVKLAVSILQKRLHSAGSSSVD